MNIKVSAKMQSQLKLISQITAAILASLIGLYPLVFFLTNKKFGLLGLKPVELFNNNLWHTTFYLHISFGGLALAVGWLQFYKKLRLTNIRLHRNIGKVYMLSVLISGICSLYIALYATGGVWSKMGFFCMGIVWVISTSLGFIAVKKVEIAKHKRYMIYSYAGCFAAVTLRIWLPVLVIIIGDFIIAYKIVAWLSWVPNILLAHYFIMKNQKNSESK